MAFRTIFLPSPFHRPSRRSLPRSLTHSPRSGNSTSLLYLPLRAHGSWYPTISLSLALGRTSPSACTCRAFAPPHCPAPFLSLTDPCMRLPERPPSTARLLESDSLSHSSYSIATQDVRRVGPLLAFAAFAAKAADILDAQDFRPVRFCNKHNLNTPEAR
ncbi:hypothetical protein K488DRAFT_92341 [Vararia minispora EC-137]|uniref:Uncharacterized protein n=1 Tax=Vararia minispora EC-137 TaxID=1314806 RepID=A0ACB8Q471_9AGAM|nr:hypothetical protein K488DRAFT_92341 [Vararia minispora EC-137]